MRCLMIGCSFNSVIFLNFVFLLCLEKFFENFLYYFFMFLESIIYILLLLNKVNLFLVVVIILNNKWSLFDDIGEGGNCSIICWYGIWKSDVRKICFWGCGWMLWFMYFISGLVFSKLFLFLNMKKKCFIL